MSLIATFDIAFDDSSSSSSNSKNNHNNNNNIQSPPSRRSHSCYRSSIYLGSKEDAKNLDLLQKRRISHILNVTPSRKDVKGGVPNYFEKQQQQKQDRSRSNSSSFTYLRIPLTDDATSVQALLSPKYVDDILNFIHRGLYHGNVLVHCRYGISRSTTCVALYLMR
jgi:protein tyrosine/serine phosphatase